MKDEKGSNALISHLHFLIVHHKLQANSDRSITNFCEDIKDCVVYSILLDQIAPLESGVDRSALKKKDPVERAEQTLKQASKIGCR